MEFFFVTVVGQVLGGGGAHHGITNCRFNSFPAQKPDKVLFPLKRSGDIVNVMRMILIPRAQSTTRIIHNRDLETHSVYAAAG